MVLVFAVLSIVTTTYGISYHQDTVPKADMVIMQKVDSNPVAWPSMLTFSSTSTSCSAYISWWHWQSSAA